MTEEDARADGQGRLGPVLVAAGAVLAVLAAGSALLTGDAPTGPDVGAVPSTAPGSAAPEEGTAGPGTDLAAATGDEPDTDDGPTLAFAATGIAGGGFQNVVSWASDGSSVLVGGDVSGLHRSVDGGVTWLPVGQGLPRWAEKIAAIAHHPTDPDVVLAAGGFAGDSGGVLRSDDGGRSWTVVDETLFFSGQHAPDQDRVPTGHPRGTGRLLLWLDDATVLAATFDDGLHRSRDGGRTWELVGLDERYLRGLARLSDGDVLVATHGRGLQRLVDPLGAATVEPVQDGPRAIEEVAVTEEGTVLAAAGRDGLWRWTEAAGWDVVDTSETTWTTVATVGDRWFAGSHEPDRVDDVREPGVARSLDRGDTWEHVLTGPSRRLTVLGTGGQRWWVAQAQDRILPDGGDWTAGQFAADPRDPDHVLLAGRAGVWATTDGGATWHPSVLGLGATVHDGAAVAPDGRIAVLNTDHRLLVSDDDLDSVVAVEPGPSKGTAIAVDATQPDGTLLVATAERDENGGGELYRLPAGTFEAVPLGLGAATGGRRVLTVTSGVAGDGGAVLLAAVEGGGVWRRSDDGPWAVVDTDAFAAGEEQPTLDAGALWLGEDVVVLLDRTRGLYRSADAGRTFERVLDVSTATDRIDPTGFVASDPTDAGAVWLSTRDGLVRVTGLGGGTVAVAPVAVARPGPVLGLDGGGALVVVRDDEDGGAPGLVLVCGDDVDPVGTGDRFAGGAVDAIDLDLDARGRLVVTTANVGVIRSVASVGTVADCG